MRQEYQLVNTQTTLGQGSFLFRNALTESTQREPRALQCPHSAASNHSNLTPLPLSGCPHTIEGNRKVFRHEQGIQRGQRLGPQGKKWGRDVGLQDPFKEIELKVSGQDKNYQTLLIALPISM